MATIVMIAASSGCQVIAGIEPGASPDDIACGASPEYVPDPVSGRRYRAVDEEATWPAAAARCVEDGAHLATIANQAENDYVFSLHDDETWIGLTDEEDEGVYRWITGEPLTFENWNDGEPNQASSDEDYVELVGGGKWNDDPLDRENRSVCECPP